jgi:hypothetical protein
MENISIPELVKVLNGIPCLVFIGAATLILVCRLWCWLKKNRWTLNIANGEESLAVRFDVPKKAEGKTGKTEQTAIEGDDSIKLLPAPKKTRNSKKTSNSKK